MVMVETNIGNIEAFREGIKTALEFAEANWDVMDRAVIKIEHFPVDITSQDHEGFKKYVEGRRSLIISMITKIPDNAR